MKQINHCVKCPNCDFTFRVMQSPWPHTGELHVYKSVKFCPDCGHKLEGDRK